MTHTLVISDLHLDKQFEKARCDKLRDLIQQADTVVICGDFWEGYAITFDEFLATPWSELFTLLKSKHTVYVYGNHDKKDKSDDRVYQFCDTATQQYQKSFGNVRYIFEHGHRLSPKIDAMLGIQKPDPLYFAISEWIQLAFVKILGPMGFWILFFGQNEKIKRASEREFSHLGSYMYVCGHTDCAEIDKKRHFANSGFCKYGHVQYLLIQENGDITLHKERY